MENFNTEQDHHWFATSILGWNVDTNIRECVNTRVKLDGKGHESKLYLVPCGIESAYEIYDSTPVVEGIVYITKF